MPARDKAIRLFQRAADQRLTTAEFLLGHGYYLDAVYLAGYSVECALKALILKRTARRDFAAMWMNLTQAGSKGHDYDYLKELLKRQNQGRGKTDREAFGLIVDRLKTVASWSTSLRYQVGNLKRKEALSFFNAAKEIRDWSARS
jgi:HEPN domain-containing protein